MRRMLLIVTILLFAGSTAALARVPAMPFNDAQPLQPGYTPAATPGEIPVRFGPGGPGNSVLDAMNYLIGSQSDVTEDNAGNGAPDVDLEDGGWDWVLTAPNYQHTSAASPTNIYGETALGLYYAYLVSPAPRALIAMQDAAAEMIADAGIRSGSDVVFLLLYGDLVSDDSAKNAAKAKYDGRIATYGSAQALVEWIRDSRHGQGFDNGIIPWDIAAWVEAAALLDAEFGGYAADAVAMAEVIYQDSFAGNPGYFQPFDTGANDGYDPDYGNPDFWYYNCGLAGIVTAFQAAGVYSTELGDCIYRLQENRFPSGAMGDANGINAGDEDWQSTAEVGRALADVNATTYAADIAAGNGWLALTQDPASGGWVYGSGSHYPQVGGEILASLAATVAVVGPDVPPSGCLSSATPCVTVPVTITRNDAALLRGFSVQVSISGGLTLCGAITDGGYLTAGHQFYVTPVDADTWIVDNAVLGSGCTTEQTGTLFNLPVASVLPGGTGVITIDSVTLRDCDNAPIQGLPGVPGSVTIDNEPPVAISTLGTAQVKAGNDGDGTTKVLVDFTAPVDADVIEVYRKEFGNYPEYDDAGGAVPAAPSSYANAAAEGWVLTGVTATGQTDEPGTRDFWYYVAYSKDECGNISAVSNVSDGTLNYHLGDVSTGSADCAGENIVDIGDISLLGAHYGTAEPDPLYLACLDVGPTTDYSVDARPTTDNRVQFEDLMMFAINFGAVSLVGDGNAVALETPVLSLQSGSASPGEVSATLVLSGNEASTKGVHALVGFDPAQLELVDVAPGPLGTGQVFFKTLPDAQGVTVDLAQLGTGAALPGSGVIATLRFRQIGAEGAPTLLAADLRDIHNGFIGAGSSSVEPVDAAPARALLARPNPFTGETSIRFALESAGRVELRVFDASGRLVRTLANGTYAAGTHDVVWDGRSESGARVSPGVYFYGFSGDGHEAARKLIVLQ